MAETLQIGSKIKSIGEQSKYIQQQDDTRTGEFVREGEVGVITEYHPYLPSIGNANPAIKEWYLVKWEEGGESVIDLCDENIRWENCHS